MRKALPLAFVPPFLLSLVLCPPAKPSKLSEALEKAIGQLTAVEIEAQFGRVNDPLLDSFVNRMGRELASVSGRNIGFHFRVLDTEIVNAFAAPYGYVYVTKGLLRFVGSEDELAGVIGHEVGHVACRHSWKTIKTSLAIDLLLSTLKSKKWRGFKSVARIASILYLLRHSRKHEYQADERGVAFSYLAGYDPNGVADFLERLERRHPRKPSKFELILSTHPLTSERVKRARGHIYARAEDPRILVRIGDGYASRGYIRRALKFYERAREKAPLNPEVVARLAAAYALLPDPDGAEQGWRLLSSLRPKDGEILSLLPHIRAVAVRLREELKGRGSPLPPEERGKAEVKLAEAERRLEAASERAQSASRRASSSLDEARDDWKSTARTLDSFSRDLSEGDDGGFLVFNMAASCLELSHRALEKVEEAAEALPMLCQELRADIGALKRALSRPAPSPQAGKALLRASMALLSAVEEMEQATSVVEGRAKKVGHEVSRLASRIETLVLMVGLLPDRPKRTLELVLNQLSGLLSTAKGLYAKALEAQEAASAARLAALEGRLDLSTAEFLPVHEERAKVMVARFLGVREEDVAKLRGMGWPYGDVVMALVLVRERGAEDPLEAIEAVPGRAAWVEEFQKERLNLDDIGILLRILGIEWEAEFGPAPPATKA